jgi:polyisoprenoid-binding protein YceI
MLTKKIIMKTTFHLLMVVGLLFANHGMAQRVYNADRISVTFFSEARLENIEAVSVKGSGSAMDVDKRTIVFKIPIRSFNFPQKLMQEHFNETYMESDKFPFATLNGKIVEEVDLTKEGSYPVTMIGTFTVHGISKQHEVKGTIVNKDGRLFLDAVLMLAVADYQIKIPNDKISNISQTIKVTVHAEYKPKK